MPVWGKVTGSHETLWGFVSGLMVFGGFLTWTTPGPFWLIASPLIIIFGTLSLMDEAFPYGRQPHLLSELGAFLAGAIIVGIVFFLGYAAPLLTLAVCLLLIKYILKFHKKFKKD